MGFNAFAYFDYDDFFSFDREMRGVKIITEKSFSKWKTVSFFDDKGFLLRKVNYYKNEIRADYRYEYSISDTLLEIKLKEYQNINNNPEEYFAHKYYYNLSKQCHRFEVYSSLRDLEKPFVWGDNFIYQDNQFQSYERHTYTNETEFTQIVYNYEENQRTEQWYYILEDSIVKEKCVSISLYQGGKLIDFIRKCTDGQSIVSGEVCWDKDCNKVHIQYSNFDKRGNWTKSYFITEKGKVFRSTREIEYW
jgi:hypothetical protein